jgi:translocation and assembly module TamB
LFELQIDRLEIIDGVLLANERRIPLDFSANDLDAAITYDYADRRHDIELHAVKMETTFQNFRPVSSRGEMRIALWPNAAEVRSLRWATPESELEASGRVDDFSDPHVEVTYNLALGLGEVGAITRTRQLQAGRVQLGGRASYSSEALSAQGDAKLAGLVWRDQRMNLSGVGGSAKLAVDDERITASSIVLHALGATLRGQAQVSGWREPKSSADKPARDAPQRGTAKFQLGGLALERLLGAFASPEAVRRRPPAGNVSGDVALQWTGSVNRASVDLALTIAPPAPLPENHVPVEGTLRARYGVADSSLRLEQANLVSGRTRLVAVGDFAARDSALQVDLTVGDLRELQPYVEIALAETNTPVPQDLSGAASFRGTLAGRLDSPSLAGHLEATSFRVELPPSAALAPVVQDVAQKVPASKPAPRIVQWDRLAADVSYSPTQAAVRNGSLSRGKAGITFEAMAQLEKGKFLPQSSFTARVRTRNAPVTDLQAFVGYSVPVSGVLDLSLDAQGTQHHPEATGQFTVKNISAYGESLSAVTGRLAFRDREAQLTDLVIAQNGARAFGDIAYHLDTERFRFNARGEGLDLAKLQRIQTQRLGVAGVAQFTASGSGTPDAPSITAHASVRNVAVNEEKLGDVTLDAVTQGHDLKLTARSQLQNAELALDGTVRLRGDFPADIKVRLDRFDLTPILLAYLEGRFQGRMSLAGSLEVKGPLRQPGRLNIAGNFERLVLAVEEVQLTNEGPIRFSVVDQVLRIDSFRIVGEGTNFTASGTAELAGGRELNLRADGSINLKLAQSFNPELVSYGQTTISAVVGGTLAKPALNGSVQVSEAGVSFIEAPLALSEINGLLVFNENRLQVQTLTAETGGGQLRLGGFISYANGLNFNLTARGDSIRLRYPEGVSSVADATLRFQGSLRDAQLSGDVTVNRFALNRRFDFALYVARMRRPVTPPDPTSVLNRIRLNVHVVSSPQLQVETSLAQISGEIDLRIRGTVAKPSVLGRINISEGEMTLAGTTYELRRGDITFTKPMQIEPILNIEAAARVREYDITLIFQGTKDQLSSTYRSEPPLPTADIINLLAVGRTREESALNQQATSSFTETLSNAVLGQAIGSAFTGRVQKLFGISRLKIDPQVGGTYAGAGAGARITIEQQVSQQFTITYITDVARPERQTVQLEFNVSRGVSVIAVRDEDGIVGFDVRVRRQRR